MTSVLKYVGIVVVPVFLSAIGNLSGTIQYRGSNTIHEWIMGGDILAVLFLFVGAFTYFLYSSLTFRLWGVGLCMVICTALARAGLLYDETAEKNQIIFWSPVLLSFLGIVLLVKYSGKKQSQG